MGKTSSFKKKLKQLMGQKTNPLLLRADKNFKNLRFCQQIMNKKFLAYSLNEQDKLNHFLFNFFRSFEINLHSYTFFKDQKGMFYLIVKYLAYDTFANKSIKIKFSSLENAFLMGLKRLGNCKPFVLVFFNLEKNVQFNLNGYKLNTLAVPKVISNQDVLLTLRTFCSFQGTALFLAEYFCEKISRLRIKSNKKILGRFISFLEKFVSFLSRSNFIGLKGLKIQLKGRLQGISRSKKVAFQFGSLSLQKFEAKLDFYQTYSITTFGCIGIKIWINYF
uniref:Ribosomal protein S3 n=1 Tax=Aureoumbra lagunensis TaxID=44058 RepID=A0A7U0KSQ9_9STRA|nr:ribosomal protein S3 [Aureoumbra lagunensis]QQW50418.1 ribosomal protein S3 [Aureoumbra lagunensis]